VIDPIYAQHPTHNLSPYIPRVSHTGAAPPGGDYQLFLSLSGGGGKEPPSSDRHGKTNIAHTLRTQKPLTRSHNK